MTLPRTCPRDRHVPRARLREARSLRHQRRPAAGPLHAPGFPGALAVQVPKGAVLSFDVATAPGSWTQPGDGGHLRRLCQSDQGTRQVFSTYIDPKRNGADRRWHGYTIDLGDLAGQKVTFIFETGTGPAGDNRYDWAGWGMPRLLAP